MKVLIIGGGGYVGRIINHAIEAVHDVTYLDLSPVPGAEDRTIVGSISSTPVVTQAVQGQDVIIFAALGTIKGAPKTSCRFIDPAFNVNLRDQYRVLSVALTQGVRKFITISSMDVYDSLKVDYVVNEDNTPRGAFKRTYGMTKHLAEQLYLTAATKYPDGSFLVLRFNLPCTAEDFALPLHHYDPAQGKKNTCATGPRDTQRLMLAALAFNTKGCHIVQTTGDLKEVRFSNAKAAALLGWSPKGE